MLTVQNHLEFRGLQFGLTSPEQESYQAKKTATQTPNTSWTRARINRHITFLHPAFLQIPACLIWFCSFVLFVLFAFFLRGFLHRLFSVFIWICFCRLVFFFIFFCFCVFLLSKFIDSLCSLLFAELDFLLNVLSTLLFPDQFSFLSSQKHHNINQWFTMIRHTSSCPNL